MRAGGWTRLVVSRSFAPGFSPLLALIIHALLVANKGKDVQSETNSENARISLNASGLKKGERPLLPWRSILNYVSLHVTPEADLLSWLLTSS
jgi:hypothetical protein